MKKILFLFLFILAISSCKKDTLEIINLNPEPSDTTIVDNYKCQSYSVFVNVDSLIKNYIP